jgi:hypothetical protein
LGHQREGSASDGRKENQINDSQQIVHQDSALLNLNMKKYETWFFDLLMRR